MAFEEYGLKPVGTRNSDPNRVSIAVTGGKKLSMGIVVGPEVLKAAGFAIEDKVRFLFGSGTDKGKLLVKKVETGLIIAEYVKGKKDGSASAGMIQCGLRKEKPIEDWSGVKIARVVVKHEVDQAQGGLLLNLPDGFFTE